MKKERIRDINFGERLIELRQKKAAAEKRRLSRACAAKEISIGESSLKDHEKGFLPSPINMEKIISYYKCSKALLVTGAEPRYQDHPEEDQEAKPPKVQEPLQYDPADVVYLARRVVRLYDDQELLRKELAELKTKNEALQNENDGLKSRLNGLEEVSKPAIDTEKKAM